ncbi:hypothetical protein [Cyanobium sp. PCC 7001]|uniref:hypothetical protein n=1 Tax=Cyanobium sp. PCC 7001 TaxID=180281 RepID=UPI00030F6CF4|nr:hypothetical protein [Cyanobium sp. PCC 7001]
MHHILALELLQLLLLGAAVIVHLTTALRGRRQDRSWSLLLAMAVLAGFCRELDPDLMDHQVLEWWAWLGRKVVYRGVIAAAVLCLLAGLLHHPAGLKAWAHGPLLLTWSAAIALLVAGSIAEDHGMMLVEEMFELAGEALVAVGAVLHRQRVLPSRSPSAGDSC